MAGDHEREVPRRELKIEVASELEKSEQEAWQRLLGTRVEVKPLPDYVASEVRRNLEQMGFGLRYVPSFDLGYVACLRERGVNKYLAELQRKYPKWKSLESLSYEERRDHSVPRNLEKWFWGRVENEDIGMPALSGQWIAVETVEKPEYGTKYPKTPFVERIGFQDDRFNVSWNEAHNAIEREKPRILSDIGVSGRSVDLRFLEVIEWNLLANREGWGKTNTYEWTNTEYRGSGDSRRLVAGSSDGGGAANVYWVHPARSNGLVGFRAAVVLGS
jgi:hypothetical protein